MRIYACCAACVRGNPPQPERTCSKMASAGYGGEKKKKETILNQDMSKFLEKRVRVKFQGGREASGILKGYDPLLNLVLDDTQEFIRDTEETSKVTEQTRNLGLVVCRGPTVVLICPGDMLESIPNPFLES